tara:strand:- start:445 stop:576 length:132 start_codon:yes stop_codon:yes gene_type:complete
MAVAKLFNPVKNVPIPVPVGIAIAQSAENRWYTELIHVLTVDL